MPPDDQALQRLYGEPPPRPTFRAGPGLAVWAIGLLLAGAGSAVLSVVSLAAATTPDAATVQLREWGVLAPDEGWTALHADGPEATSGCLLTREELVRWEDRAPRKRVSLVGAELTVDGRGLEVLHGDQRVHCPSDPGSDLRAFAGLIRGRTKARELDWHPGPDPRVAHLYE